MMPIGPLMVEHRLIERMIKVIIKKEMHKPGKTGQLDLAFIDTVIDFFRMYADRCHHGKEEDILFRELRKKELNAEQKKIMDELLHDHLLGRKLVGELLEAKRNYSEGIIETLGDIQRLIQALIDFYPEHIKKEDKHFFFPIMDYFSKEEKDALLREGYELDMKLIHEKYQSLVEHLEK